MKNLKFIFLFICAIGVISCSDDDGEAPLIDDGTVGEERFLVVSQTQTIADVSTNGVVTATAGQNNGLTIQGYVMPNFLGSVTATATITFDSSVSASYNGQPLNSGDSFQVEEWFADSSFFTVLYNPTDVGETTINFSFVNSLGSQFNLSQTVTVQ